MVAEPVCPEDSNASTVAVVDGGATGVMGYVVDASREGRCGDDTLTPSLRAMAVSTGRLIG